MQDILTALATAVEIAIVALPTLRLVSQLMPRRTRVSPGQLELPLFPPTQPDSEPNIIDYPAEFAPLPVALEAGDRDIEEWVMLTTTPQTPAIEPDPWEMVEVEPVQAESHVLRLPEAVAPLHITPAYLQLLPPAKEQAKSQQRPGLPADKVVFLTMLAEPDFDSMTPKQLRDECQKHGIKWRNCYGKNRHMPVKEMRDRLRATV